MDFLGTPSGGVLDEILNRLEDPIFLIDEQGTVLFRNAAAMRTLKADTSLGVRRGRLVFLAPSNKMSLEKTLLDCKGSSAVNTGKCRGVRMSRQSAANKHWLVIVSLLSASYGDKAVGHVFVVKLIGRLYPRQLSHTLLRELFGLARQEIEVIVGLLRNESLKRIAERMHLSHETIRAYLKRIFRKCDVHSQLELFTLLHKISLLSK